MTRHETNRLARRRHREAQQQREAAEAEHQCNGARPWCWPCETADAVQHAASRPRERRPTNIDFDLFAVFAGHGLWGR